MTTLTTVLLLLTLIGASQSAVAPEPDFTIHATRTDTAPVIDGTIGADEWKSAARASDFIQYEPRRGNPSTVPTLALVLYDSTHIYVAFSVMDPEPPVAQLTRRDAHLLNDDAVVLVLDTHNDKQSAYYFMTNLLGTQTDGRIANDGRTVDDTWDAPWETASRLVDGGWTVEMSIPFTSMSYAAGEDQTWGINFGCSRRRTLELGFWAGPLDNQFRISQAGSIRGIHVAPPARRHAAILYGLARYEDGRSPSYDVGGDLRYSFTPELKAYLTLNPDLATIEADQERINLTRFELALQEKRPFFLESAELFRQRIRTFYSRRISDIAGGGQTIGRAENWNGVGLVTTSQLPEDSTWATYAVGRGQRNFGSSNVALALANRTVSGFNQGSAGADATIFFTPTLGVTAQFAQSYGESSSGTMGYFLRPSWDTTTSHFHVRYTDLGEGFGDNVNVIGFVRDDDRREWDSAFEHAFWFTDNAFERIVYDSNYNLYHGHGGELRSWQVDQSLDIDLRNRISIGSAYQEEFKQFEDEFRNHALEFTLGYNTRAFNSAQVGYRYGRNFDSDFRLMTAAAAYALTQGLSLEYELQRLTLDPDPDLATTWIHVARLNQFFTRDLYLRVFFQTNSSIDRENIQAVLVYRYKPPFGTLQLAYQRGTAEFGQASTQGNTLFLKTTLVF